MAKLIYRAIAPDGTPMEKVVPDHCIHTVMVVGYMRLRKPLPKKNPDDETEEVTYERLKRWILIGTSENQKAAERLAGCQGYRGITEQVVYLPVVGEPYHSGKPAPGRKGATHEDDDDIESSDPGDDSLPPTGEVFTDIAEELHQELATVSAGPLDLDDL